MKVSDIQKVLRAEVIAGEEELDREVRSGAGSDLMSDILTIPTTDMVLLTGLNHVQVIRSSVIAGVVAVIMVRGKRPGEEVISQAKLHNMPLLSTPFSMFTACGRLFSKGLRGVEKHSGEVRQQEVPRPK